MPNDEPPKGSGKGEEPPKWGKKGDSPGGGSPSGCGNDSATNILRSAADLCGFLVVAVIAPMGGSGGATSCSGASAQKVAVSELRREADRRAREAQGAAGTVAPAPLR